MSLGQCHRVALKRCDMAIGDLRLDVVLAIDTLLEMIAPESGLISVYEVGLLLSCPGRKEQYGN